MNHPRHPEPPTEDEADQAATALTRWAVTTPHRSARPDTRYPLTPEGDRRAWLDQLSGQIARDRTTLTRAARRMN